MAIGRAAVTNTTASVPLRQWHRERYPATLSVSSGILQEQTTIPLGVAQSPVAYNQSDPSGLTSPTASLSHGRLISAAGFSFCVVNAAIFTAAIANLLKGEQPYNDLITGSLGWTNADKGFDFRIFYVFLASTGAWWMTLARLLKRLDYTSDMRLAVNRILMLSLSPGIFWLGSRLATNAIGSAPIECLLCGVATLILMFALSRRCLAVTPAAISSVMNASLVVLMLAYFGGLGILTVCARTLHIVNGAANAILIVSLSCGAAFVALIATMLSSSCVSQLKARIWHTVFVSQVFVPLLCAVVMPPALLVDGRTITSSPNLTLAAAILLTMLLGWISLIRRWRQYVRTGAADLTQALVASALLPVAIFIAVNHASFAFSYGDDFHLGEHLLPWQQLRHFGNLPFVGFVPVHPLMDLIVGAANDFFFDGTLANYENTRSVLFAVMAGLTFLAVCRFASIGIALCLALAGSLWDRLLIVTPVLAVLCHPSLIANRQRWLIVSGVLCFASTCYNPSAGIAIVIAFTPLALFQGYRLWIEDRNKLLLPTVLFTVCAGVICVIPQLRGMFSGFVHFLVENGRNVTLAHGAEWQSEAAKMPPVKGVMAAPLVWEGVRFSWVLVLLFAAWKLITAESHRASKYLPTAVCLFLLCLATWTLNRIDPFNPSRPGEVSCLACLYLLPLVLVATGSWRSAFIPVFLFGASFVQTAFTGFLSGGSNAHWALSSNSFIEKSAASLVVPRGSVFIDGPAVGLPNLGKTYVPAKVANSLLKLKLATTELLGPGETFFDLTNRQANYFYLDLPVACSYGAPWLAANTVLQNRLLAEVQRRPPPLVWIAPAVNHDTGTPALRAYKLYRFFTLNYLPIARGDLTFLVPPVRAAAIAPARSEQMKLLEATFNNPNLGRLPSAWGASWPRLANRFSAVQLAKTKDAPITNGLESPLDFGQGKIDGRNCDFVRFEFWSNLRSEAETDLEIAWTSENGPGVARFRAANRLNLVPLGSFPQWLLSRQISDVAIRPVSPPPNLRYVVRDAQLLQLKD